MTKEEREDAIKFFKEVAEKEVNNAKYSRLAIEALKQEPCEDYISRQEALNVVHKYFEHYLQLNDDICLDGLRSLPSVTPKEKTWHWIDDEFGSKCSCCDIHTHLDKFDKPMKFKYCSMCGAKMEVENG